MVDMVVNVSFPENIMDQGQDLIHVRPVQSGYIGRRKEQANPSEVTTLNP